MSGLTLYSLTLSLQYSAMQQVFDMTFHRVMFCENFSRGGFPLPSLWLKIWSILLHMHDGRVCFKGMVSAPHAKPTASNKFNIVNANSFNQMFQLKSNSTFSD